MFFNRRREEKRRKAEEKKRKSKNALKAALVGLVIIAGIVTIGSIGESTTDIDNTPPSSQVEYSDTLEAIAPEQDGELLVDDDMIVDEPMEDPADEPTVADPQAENKLPPSDSFFEVHYIDVGQADCALVLCDGEVMLIDGGNTDDSSLVYTYLKNNRVSHLNYIVATHGHEDHVGGLAGALNYASVDTVYCAVTDYDSSAFDDFVKYLDKQGKSLVIPSAGDTFPLGSASVEILGVDSYSSDPNNSSIVLRIVYGDTAFLFTGDAEREAEQTILNSGHTLQSTVLKVGHHGSENATTYPFLREIMPQYAVISVGEGNTYGHPTEATLSRLRDADVVVYRTDMQGDVICTSDGAQVSFHVERNADADTFASYKPVTPPPAPVVTTPPVTTEPENPSIGTDYVGNKNSMKFHYDWCNSVDKMKESNKFYYTGTRDEMLSMNYEPCKNCNP